MHAVNAVLFALVGCSLGQADGGKGKTQVEYDPAIKPYVAFLEKDHLSAVDYVMHLFEEHDIVIICERWHAETTQWDLLYDITRDPRFIDRVGHIFTEYCTVSLQPYIDEFLTTRGLSEGEVTQRVLHIFRNFTFHPMWEKYPFYKYLHRLYRLNDSLPDDKRIHLHVTDLPFDWSEMTVESYRAFDKGVLNKRDRHMADVVIEGYRELRKSARRKKCLVVMNYRHAFQPVQWENGVTADNTGTYVFRAFPKKTANVLLNTIVYSVVPGSKRDRVKEIWPAQDGKWDAAFAVRGNPAIGFDFAGSPFGEDSFDLFPYDPAIRNLKYRQVFTGFVFYKSPSEHCLCFCVPGLYDEAFRVEANRRIAIQDEALGQPKGFELSPEYVKKYEARGSKDVKDKLGYAKQELVDRWLRKPAKRAEPADKE